MKILYWVSVNVHLRMVFPIPEINGIDQAIVLPKSVSNKGLKIKKIYNYDKTSDIESVIDDFKPDAFVQYSSSRDLAKFIKNKSILHVFSAHGVWPESDLNKIIVSDPFFNTFDLVCGASYKIKKIFTEYSNPNANVATNTLTQFDTLYNLQSSNEERKKKLIGKANKLIVLFGHKITKKSDKLRPYDRGYYDVASKLAELAQKYNWMVYVKPKTWPDKRLPKDNLNFKVLSDNPNPYRYFCSDLIITSARSSIEVEAALTKSPIARIFMPTTKLTNEQKSYEYGALDFDAEYLIKSQEQLEDMILKCDEDHVELNKKQEKFVKHLGIIFDGKAHIRFIEAIKKSIGER